MTTDTETTEPVQDQAPANLGPPPPPNANIPQGPSAHAGGFDPQPNGGGMRRNRKLLPLLAMGFGTVLLFVILLAMCGAGGGSTKTTSTTVAPGADELTEVNPAVFWPPFTPTARELIGPSRDNRLTFARQVSTLTSPSGAKATPINPCEIWATKNVYIEITWATHWTVDYPVPVFECPRSATGAYLPPAIPAPAGSPPIGSTGTAPASPAATTTPAKGE